MRNLTFVETIKILLIVLELWETIYRTFFRCFCSLFYLPTYRLLPLKPQKKPIFADLGDTKIEFS